MEEQGVSKQKSRHLILSKTSKCLLKRWLVSEDQKVRTGTVLCKYIAVGTSKEEDFRSPCVGLVKYIAVKEEQFVEKSSPVAILVEKCDHSVVVHDLCCDCGMDMRSTQNTATVSMIHNMPQIRLSKEEASIVAKKDKQHLLDHRKLELIVDLDQTLIHTSMNPSIPPGLPDVYEFQLEELPYTYHCRLRPHTRDFLEKVAKFYQLHIFTMGTRSYAERVAMIIDPEGKFFCRRILSRDEFLDPRSKSVSLESVFPEGTEMVVIIDDREDVWRNCPNLVHVKPYLFFADVGDINAPSNGTAQNNYCLPQQRPSPSSSDDPPLKVARMQECEQPGSDDPVPTGCEDVPVETLGDSNGDTAEDEVCPGDVQEESMDTGESTVNTDKGDPPCSSTLASTKEDAVATIVPATDSQDTSDDSSSSSSSSNSGSDSESSSSSESNEDRENETAKKDTKAPKSADSTDAKVKVTDPKILETPTSANHDNTSANDPVSVGEERGKQPRAEIESGAKTVIDKAPKPKNIKDSDSFLMYLGDILERIHQRFYKAHDALVTGENPDMRPPDVKIIIPELRLSVFKDVRILFTGVIPNNQPVEKNREWNTARAFGAEIHTDVKPGLDSPHVWKKSKATTHVVVGKKGTEKLKKAFKVPGLQFITVKWLWSCAEQWKVLPEEAFRVDGIDYASLPKLTTPQPVPIHNRSMSVTQCKPARLNLKIRAVSVPEDTSTSLLSPSSVVSFTPKEWDEMSKEVDDEISSGEDNPSDVSLLMDSSLRQEDENEQDDEQCQDDEEEEEKEEEDEEDSSGSSDDTNDDSEDELAKLI